MATHSSTLAWRIPRSEETGGLQSVGQSLTRLSEQTIATHSLCLYSSHKPEVLAVMVITFYLCFSFPKVKLYLDSFDSS